MPGKTTMPGIYWPLMDGPTVKAPFCVVCGAARPLNQHHVVPRSRGELYRDGKKLEKPTLTLCGHGNASGCHGEAHAYRLHFRVNDGRWEFLRTDVPTRYEDALGMGGWAPIHEPQEWEL